MSKANNNLHKAKKAKNDEFYTQLSDIEKELKHYKRHFKNKVVFLNCDDPQESNFWRFFSANFEFLGLKKLISTHYVELSEPCLNDITSYKLEIIRDVNGDGKVNDLDTIKTPLQGNGDFRSEECVAILKEADIVVTNPPFSLFREYISLLVEHKKKFIVVGNNNAITYKDIFKLIKENKLWIGVNGNKTMEFELPDNYKKWNRMDEKTGKKFGNVPAISWFTNLNIKKRHEDITLYKEYKKNKSDYPKYDNYNAINVDKVVDIPMDYDGVMGVPITFLNKFNPKQFEIVGITKTWFGGASKTYPRQKQVNANGKESSVTKLNDGATLKVDTPPQKKTYYIVKNESYIQLYARILIKRK